MRERRELLRSLIRGMRRFRADLRRSDRPNREREARMLGGLVRDWRAELRPLDRERRALIRAIAAGMHRPPWIP